MILDKKKHAEGANVTNENNTLMLKMVTSYSIFLLVILFLFCFVYYSSLNNTRNSYNCQNETTFISNVELFENDLHIMEVYCRQLLQNDSFRKIMNYEFTGSANQNVPANEGSIYSHEDQRFIDLGIKLQTALATDIYAEALLPIKEAFCYFPLTDTILNPTYFTSHDRFYDWIQRYPADKKELWLQYLTEDEYSNRFLPMEEFTSTHSRNYYLYITNLSDLYYLKAHARVGFIIEETELSALFNCLTDNPDSFLAVADENGKLLLSINSNMFDQSGESENVFDTDTLSSLRYTNNFAPYNDTDLTVGKYISHNTGYTYYYSFPAFETTTNTDSMRLVFILIFLAALLIGGVLVFFFSKRNVTPIIELGQELHEAVAAQNHLQEMVDSQRPIICTSYVRKLLSGTSTSQEETTYIENYLGIPAGSYYNVLYVVVYNNSGDAAETLANGLPSSDELQNAITNALKNFLGDSLYYFSPTDRTYAILLHCDAKEEKDFVLQISNLVLRLHDFVLDTYGIWLFAGIGRNTDSLMNVWEAYQQAMEAVNYTTKNYIFFPYEFIKKNSNVFYYPPEISTKLIHFISTGNTSQVLELFNLIHQENIEERSLPINLLKYLLSDIRNTLLKARFALPADADAETVRILDERFNEHLSFKLCEDLALTLCNLFASKTEDKDLATIIEKYIAQNYKDPSLGLNKISDEFQISESYFSHMFKEKTGSNFSTYLETIRLNEAVRLIRETDISLNELYMAVGYNNANTFRRAFKKVFGVTPSSMRESTT